MSRIGGGSVRWQVSEGARGCWRSFSLLASRRSSRGAASEAGGDRRPSHAEADSRPPWSPTSAASATSRSTTCRYAGLERAEKELGVEIKVLESKEIDGLREQHHQLANAGYNPIFAVGFLMTDTVSKVATALPGHATSAASTSSSTRPGAERRRPELQGAGRLATSPASWPVWPPRTRLRPAHQRPEGHRLRGRHGRSRWSRSSRPASSPASSRSNPDVKVICCTRVTSPTRRRARSSACRSSTRGATSSSPPPARPVSAPSRRARSKKALFIGVDADQFLHDPGLGRHRSSPRRQARRQRRVRRRQGGGRRHVPRRREPGLRPQGGRRGLAPFHDFEAKVPQAIKDAVEKAKAGHHRRHGRRFPRRP